MVLCLLPADEGTAELELLFDHGLLKQHVSITDGKKKAMYQFIIILVCKTNTEQKVHEDNLVKTFIGNVPSI